MEIRRKVFSLLQDENGEERYYSTNEFVLSYDEETGEKLFSAKEIAKKAVKFIKEQGKEISGAAKGILNKNIVAKTAKTTNGKARRYIDKETGKLVGGLKGQNSKLNKLGLTKGETKLVGAVGVTAGTATAIAVPKKNNN